jgi:hypothetical protein
MLTKPIAAVNESDPHFDRRGSNPTHRSSTGNLAAPLHDHIRVLYERLASFDQRVDRRDHGQR